MLRVFKSIPASAYYSRLQNVIVRWLSSLRPRRLNVNPPPLLAKRLQLLGLDPTFIAVTQPSILRNLAARCRDCTHTDACAADLGAENAAGGMDSYCANGDIIDDLVIKRATG